MTPTFPAILRQSNLTLAIELFSILVGLLAQGPPQPFNLEDRLAKLQVRHFGNMHLAEEDITLTAMFQLEIHPHGRIGDELEEDVEDMEAP